MQKILSIFILICMLSTLLIGCDLNTHEDANKDGSHLDDSTADNKDNESTEQTPSIEDKPGNDSTPENPDNGGENAGDGESTEPGGSTDENPTNPEEPEHIHEFVKGKCECGESDPDYEPEIGTKIGDRFADIVLEGLNGEEIDTSDYRGKYIVLNVWGTWCGPCKSELPHFNQFASAYEDEVVVIAAHSYYYREYAKNYVHSNFASSKILFAYDTENDDAFYAAGGSQYYPKTVIIDPDGIIIYGRDGTMNYSELEKIINGDKNKQ